MIGTASNAESSKSRNPVPTACRPLHGATRVSRRTLRRIAGGSRFMPRTVSHIRNCCGSGQCATEVPTRTASRGSPSAGDGAGGRHGGIAASVAGRDPLLTGHRPVGYNRHPWNDKSRYGSPRESCGRWTAGRDANGAGGPTSSARRWPLTSISPTRGWASPWGPSSLT